MNQKTHQRIITELSRCEEKMDTVLFDAGDQAMGATAATVGIGGLGAGLYLKGRKGLKRAATFDPQDIGATIGRGVGAAANDIKDAGSSLWENLLKWSRRAKSAI